MPTVASFEVKNNGKKTVIVYRQKLPGVEIPPGETSKPFTEAGEYSIISEIGPEPERSEVIVDFKPKPEGHLDAKKKHSHWDDVKVDVIARFDWLKGDAVLP